MGFSCESHFSDTEPDGGGTPSKGGDLFTCTAGISVIGGV